ncbi:MAG: hypothetical protein O9302_12680 [Cyclobacteriaceae bacterium]|jgi:hypothetical protein|nr:hypothetical protein [Cytophagales bacterium]MCZ8328913.1 hypothetical protein [Cyclobacteriaceae bacterium]
MRKLWILLLITVACGPGLTEEQKRKIKAEMEAGQVKRVSEAAILEAAMLQGKNLVDLAKNSGKAKTQNEFGKVEMLYQKPNYASETESMVWEALKTQASGENVQKLGADTILYTAPVWGKSKTNQDSVVAVWRVALSKKQLVLKL